MATDIQTFRATALLAGTVIGAGVLGIPYAVAEAGFFTGLVMIVLIGFGMMLLNLFLGEISLRTAGNHQLPGYAEKYLGKGGKKAMAVASFFGIYGALIAYLIGEGQALSAIFGGPLLMFTLLFFIFASILVFRGLKSISKSEIYFLLIVLFLVLFIAIIAAFSGEISSKHITSFNIFNLMLPFGVLLFAYRGIVAVPEMKEYLTRDRKKLKKAIIIGSFIPLGAYIIFTAAVVGITGIKTTEIATIGLGQHLGPSMVLFGNIFAIFAMLTSFLTLALAMKEIYMYDFKIKEKRAWALTMFVPLIVFLLGANSFITVISITGAFSVGFEGILIVLMFWKAKQKGNRIPEYSLGKNYLLGIVLILIFILGMIYQAMYL